MFTSSLPGARAFSIAPGCSAEIRLNEVCRCFVLKEKVLPSREAEICHTADASLVDSGFGSVARTRGKVVFGPVAKLEDRVRARHPPDFFRSLCRMPRTRKAKERLPT